MSKKLMFSNRESGTEREINWLQIFQVLGIILSILFVGYELMKNNFQLQENNELTLAKNAQDIVEMSSSFTIMLINDQKNAQVWSHGKQGYSELEDQDKYLYQEMLYWWLAFYENVLYQKNSIDVDVFNTWQKRMKIFMQEKLPENFWKDNQHLFSPKFSLYLQDFLAIEKNLDNQ